MKDWKAKEQQPAEKKKKVVLMDEYQEGYGRKHMFDAQFANNADSAPAGLVPAPSQKFTTQSSSMAHESLAALQVNQQ